MRRHYTQMSREEVGILLNQVRSRDYTNRSHAEDRMRQKSVSESDIRACLSYGVIIEAHTLVANDLRVLVRGKVKGNFVCVVVSLTRSEIVTTYWNQAGDNHKTLDKSQYGLTLTVPELISRYVH